ncbi:PepSY-associated TM helix domain-containing protein [Paracoccus aerodenitrificans]|nr:PepSY-associated TM helix domain-containing protein [Paracoccus aerodenitrificans]WBU65655.1 PepSY-associated TM helix domain-containing protein [Paracoccus aerodenitrificans]
MFLWATGPRRKRNLAAMPPVQRMRWIHGSIGVSLSVVLILVSITGLTWSKMGGARIDAARTAIGWTTPSVSLDLDRTAATGSGHEAHMAEPVSHAIREDRVDQLDAVLMASRQAGLDSPMIEIRLPKPGEAWMVREYDRSWPTQVDTIALSPDALQITSRADFAEFTLIPKLIRWGIDAHMGVLFGVVNQLLMAVVAGATMILIVYGYRIWWTKRPAAGAQPLSEAFNAMSAGARLVWLMLAILLGWAMPVFGISILGFVLADMLRWRLSQRRTSIS